MIDYPYPWSRYKKAEIDFANLYDVWAKSGKRLPTKIKPDEDWVVGFDTWILRKFNLSYRTVTDNGRDITFIWHHLPDDVADALVRISQIEEADAAYVVFRAFLASRGWFK